MIKIVSPSSGDWELFSDMIPQEKLSPSDTKVLYVALSEESEACGALIIDFEFEVYQIDFLYVIPEMRRRGIATALIDNLIEHVQDEPDGMDIAVDIRYTAESEGLCKFFADRNDFDMTASPEEYRVYAGDLHQFPMIGKLMKASVNEHVAELGECAGQKWNYYITELHHHGLDFAAELKAGDLEPDLTQIYKDDDGNPCAIIAVEKPDGNLLRVLFLGSTAASSGTLSLLLGSVFEEYRAKYNDKYLEFVLTNPEMERLIEALFGEYAHRMSTNRFVYNWYVDIDDVSEDELEDDSEDDSEDDPEAGYGNDTEQ